MRQDSRKRRVNAQRALILEMIEASMQKAAEKGPHSLTRGCNCIVCVNRRKRILAGPERQWRYRL
ncbi:MAG: hypothetical protein KGY42_03355 [Desulfobacterales bacterium]|nr:hypothetical protein [Desulfobacterales bacterium]MBS3756434.1 hypothetical protein [Desulfobacterales bacterium]